MPVPTQLSDLSATAASNSPAGGDTVGTTMDDYLRAIQSIIVRISAGTDAMATPNIGAATGTSLVLSGLATVNGAFTSLGLDDNATATALTLSGSGANSVTIANSATNPTIGTSAGSLALISATGFVGINMTSPGNYLHIQSGDTQIRFGITTGSAYYDVGRDTVDGLFQFNGAQATFVGYKWKVTSGAEVARIAGDGTTTLGGSSTAPQVKINVTASADRYITLTGSNGANPKIGTSAGQLTLGTGSALATSATEGYVCIPTCAGTPTGVPAGAGAGNLPLIYDTTNNKLYAYNGAWKATAALT